MSFHVFILKKKEFYRRNCIKVCFTIYLPFKFFQLTMCWNRAARVAKSDIETFFRMSRENETEAKVFDNMQGDWKWIFQQKTFSWKLLLVSFSIFISIFIENEIFLSCLMKPAAKIFKKLINILKKMKKNLWEE